MYNKCIKYFSKLGKRYLRGYVLPLKDVIEKSNLTMLFDTYIGKMLFFSILVFFLSFIFSFVFLLFFRVEIIFSLIGSLLISLVLGGITLVLYHSYPFHIIRSRKISIENNLPFAMSHMAAIASSGVPPFVIFKLISNIREYGEITNECSRIIRNIDVFGMDITTAIKNVANRTPSSIFSKFLQGIVSTIETGGDLVQYIQNSAKESLFDYRLKRESYMQTLSTYADFYTAILIAAPLFFVSVLSIMALVGGEVFGMAIPTLIQIGVYALIPLLNIIFLMFVHYTQPTI